jgi:hypothetical protein
MGREEREAYDELKQKYHHEEKKLHRVGISPHKTGKHPFQPPRTMRSVRASILPVDLARIFHI